MIWKRTLLLGLLAVTGLALETSLFGSATLAGAKPQLLLLATVALGMIEGPESGAVAGFTLGLATDVLGSRPAGLAALIYTILGFAVGRLRVQVQTPTAWLPIAMEGAAAFLATVLYGGLAALLGETVGAADLVRFGGLSALYNALLTPFVFPVVRVLAERLRVQKVYQL